MNKQTKNEKKEKLVRWYPFAHLEDGNGQPTRRVRVRRTPAHALMVEHCARHSPSTVQIGAGPAGLVFECVRVSMAKKETMTTRALGYKN